MAEAAVDSRTDFEKLFDVLREAIAVVISGQIMTPQMYEHTYQAVCDCFYKERTLFTVDGFFNPLNELIAEQWTLITATAAELTGESLLEFYTSKWRALQSSVIMLINVLRYPARYPCDVRPVVSAAVPIFKRTVFDPLEQKIRSAVLEELSMARNVEIIDREYTSNVIHSLIQMANGDLRLYQESIEGPYLEETRIFHVNKATTLGQIENLDSFEEYLTKVHECVEQEEIKVSVLLHEKTLEKIHTTCKDAMLAVHFGFIQSQFRSLLVEQAESTENRLFQMFQPCRFFPLALDAQHQALQLHVTEEARVALKGIQDPKAYVGAVLKVLKKYRGLVSRKLCQNPEFMKAIDLAIVDIMKDTVNGLKSVEMVAKYCDDMMRKSTRNKDDMEVMGKKAINIFKYVEEKDLFRRHYIRNLSNRLIHNVSGSDEAETSFIAKLTKICGHDYTSRLVKIVQDWQVSNGLTMEYKDSEQVKVDFSVLILSTGIWPTYPQVVFDLPKVLSSAVEGFQAFYNKKYVGRKLQWMHGLSRGELFYAPAQGKRYALGVTTAQMCTLLIFNEQVSYDTEKLMNATGMDAKTLSPVLGSLVQHQVLSSDVPLVEGNEMPPNAIISLNLEYSNDKVRVDLSRAMVAARAARDTEKDRSSIDEERKSVISACIIRIMKAHKTLSHQALITEVIDQLEEKFKTKVELIKRTIGNLIEDGYIRRNAEQRDIYEYTA